MAEDEPLIFGKPLASGDRTLPAFLQIIVALLKHKGMPSFGFSSGCSSIHRVIHLVIVA